ncbi:hypothetical protein [Serratia marcescens]|uniref:hypothetical protein n=1 Tax=Serratia marcescens TaxID=615 RepID=UPI001ED953C3|nr:hypothetical protein [Serratia marcescens]
MAEIWAARKDDELIHTSALADIASAVAEVAVYAVATAAVSAAAPPQRRHWQGWRCSAQRRRRPPAASAPG